MVIYGLCIIGAFYFLWMLYLAVMSLRRARRAGDLTPVAFALGVPLLLIGGALDILLNYTVVSLLFLEWPPFREWTISARLTRYVHAAGWRGRVARWVCQHLLDTFDPTGAHCD